VAHLCEIHSRLPKEYLWISDKCGFGSTYAEGDSGVDAGSIAYLTGPQTFALAQELEAAAIAALNRVC
jgi:hypothetical protein